MHLLLLFLRGFLKQPFWMSAATNYEKNMTYISKTLLLQGSDLITWCFFPITCFAVQRLTVGHCRGDNLTHCFYSQSSTTAALKNL